MLYRQSNNGMKKSSKGLKSSSGSSFVMLSTGRIPHRYFDIVLRK